MVEERLFGWIHGDDNREYFFHRDDLVNRPDWEECSSGRHCTFIPVEPQPSRGPRAAEVMIL